jgi:hypothetical protein
VRALKNRTTPVVANLTDRPLFGTGQEGRPQQSLPFSTAIARTGWPGNPVRTIDAAVAEVERFERSPDPADFALADAQRLLARAYGFSSWPALKNHVEGVNFAAFLAAAEAGDVAAVRRLAKTRPDLVIPRGPSSATARSIAPCCVAMRS